MKERNRVFYVGMITTDAYAGAMGERAFDGAAARKMLLVVQALRAVGRRAVIVSLPFLSGAKRAFYPAVLTKNGAVPTVFVATLRSRLLRKIVGSIFLASFFLRKAAAGDTVIFYNHAVEYLPTLLVLRLRGMNLVQDIEDAPTDDEKGIRGVLNRLSFAIVSKLTNQRKMVVAGHVADGLALDDYVVIRGVAALERPPNDEAQSTKWRDLRAGGDLLLHFGGTLIPETGVDLFCEAVKRLVLSEEKLNRRIRFKITGVGHLNKIGALQKSIQKSAMVRVDLCPELCKTDYLNLIEGCHGSISLKRPGSSMANTTFPSKVIEITASGMALISSRLGDVPALFGEDAAYFLSEYLPNELANIFIRMAADPSHVERIAHTGQGLCNRLFSQKAVGEEMTRLL